MQKFKTLDDAIELARYAHRHQLDKAGLPYFDHPYRVMQAVQGMGGQPYVQIAAILHDVTEDTAFTCDMLLDLGFSEAAVEVIRLVDRDASRVMWEKTANAYKSYTGQLYDVTVDDFYYIQIRNSPGALMVKRADIADNTQPWRLSYLPEETQVRLISKYENALQILNDSPLNHLRVPSFTIGD